LLPTTITTTTNVTALATATNHRNCRYQEILLPLITVTTVAS
jgi:hypothetical protein